MHSSESREETESGLTRYWPFAVGFGRRNRDRAWHEADKASGGQRRRASWLPVPKLTKGNNENIKRR